MNFNINTALLMSDYSKLAYSLETVENIPDFKKEHSIIRIDGVEMCIYFDDNDIIVVFAGTNEFEDWYVNINVILTHSPWGGKVHTGFLTAYLSIMSELEAVLEKKGARKKRVVFTGHSMGGALAILAACHYREVYGDNFIVYTFGSPKVGNNKFTTNNQVVDFNTIRVVNSNDITPRLPGKIFYRHIGKEYYFNRKGMCVEAPSISYRLFDRVLSFFGRKEKMYLSTVKKFHSVEKYCEILSEYQDILSRHYENHRSVL